MSLFPSGGEVSSAEPSSILVVEDDSSTARLLNALLSSHGYAVRVAVSVAEARQALATAPCDLLLLDRMLPDGDGLELAREMKSSDAALHRYILMLTAVASEQAKIEGFDGGADDYVTKPFLHEELLARVRAGLRIVELQKALISANRTLERLSITDGTTGVYNRRWFDRELERAFAQSIRYERPMSLAMIDIDHFKSVNDTHGHLVGDSALHGVAERVSGALRKPDAIARLGGEEFGVILPETALFEGLQFGEKIRSAINTQPFDTDSGPIYLTVSVGIASLPHSCFRNASQLLSFTDLALYRAKARGRNRVELERRATPWRATQPVSDVRAALS